MNPIGFLEESSGVRSMTRLAIGVLLVLTSLVVIATCWYVVKGAPNAGVVGALAGVIGALVLNGIVAIAKRGHAEESPS
jgi:hypothetical protein